MIILMNSFCYFFVTIVDKSIINKAIINKATMEMILLLLLCFQFEEHPKKTVKQNGMEVSWFIQDNRVYFEMQAPTEGWVAIGLHTKNQLQGTNLIMGSISNQGLKVEDHYIQAVGKHQETKAIGGGNALLDTHGKASKTQTTIAFSLPLQAPDIFHKNLKEGKTYYLLMAYSEEDDFQHHSRMRTTISITL